MQSPERLRLLLILTVVDIRAVGPTTWNDWKRQLLRDLVRRRRGAAAAGPQAARAQRAGRRAAGGACRRRCGWKASAAEGPCAAPARQLLAGRAARMADRQCAPGRRGRGAHRRCRAERRRRARSGIGRDPRVSVFAPDRAGPVLPHLRRARGGRGVDRRCAHPHHARRHGARQSAGHRRARAGPMPTARLRARLVAAVEAALERRGAAPRPRRRHVAPRAGLRSRAVGR